MVDQEIDAATLKSKMGALAAILDQPDEFYDSLEDLYFKKPNEILENFLWLGDGESSKNTSVLEKKGVYYILNVAPEGVDTGKEFYKPPFVYHQIHSDDEPGYDILAHLDETTEFFERVRSEKGRVLLHCAAGWNRSGALCVAYCMVFNDWSVEKAVKYVFDRRPFILSNVSFREQLIRFDHKREKEKRK